MKIYSHTVMSALLLSSIGTIPSKASSLKPRVGIIGGGISGLSAARQLNLNGFDTVGNISKSIHCITA